MNTIQIKIKDDVKFVAMNMMQLPGCLPYALSNIFHLHLHCLGKNKNRVDQLKLALVWNRIDIAKEKIFTSTTKWKVSNITRPLNDWEVCHMTNTWMLVNHMSLYRKASHMNTKGEVRSSIIVREPKLLFDPNPYSIDIVFFSFDCET